MKINKETMLFEDISPETKVEMLKWVKPVVLKDSIPTEPKWLLDWMETFNYSTRERYVLSSTLFAQRVMLSLLVDGSKEVVL